MKKTFILLGFFVANLVSVTNAAPDVHAKTNTYMASCRFEQPLDTYSSCSEDSYAGLNAFQCAREEAISKCKISYNADCIVVGFNFTSIISQEFVGYKACESKVYVHGYRLN